MSKSAVLRASGGVARQLIDAITNKGKGLLRPKSDFYRNLNQARKSKLKVEIIMITGPVRYTYLATAQPAKHWQRTLTTLTRNRLCPSFEL